MPEEGYAALVDAGGTAESRLDALDGLRGFAVLAVQGPRSTDLLAALGLPTDAIRPVATTIAVTNAPTAKRPMCIVVEANSTQSSRKPMTTQIHQDMTIVVSA